jgi:hypothetical protein
MAKFKIPKIEDVGLETYLDEYGKNHPSGGLPITYHNFISLAEAKVDLSNMARAFGVARNTIVRWYKIYENTK